MQKKVAEDILALINEGYLVEFVKANPKIDYSGGVDCIMVYLPTYGTSVQFVLDIMCVPMEYNAFVVSQEDEYIALDREVDNPLEYMRKIEKLFGIGQRYSCGYEEEKDGV